MVKVSVIVSNEEVIKQTLDDIEVTGSLGEAKGEYVYFKHYGDVLDEDMLAIAYEECMKNDLDYVVFNSKGEQFLEMEDGIYTIDDLYETLFHTDFKITSKLIKRSIIEEDFTHDNKYVLNWEVMLKARRISFLNTALYESTKMENDVNAAIDTYNIIFRRLVDVKYLHLFKYDVYNYKLEGLLDIYERTPEESKEYVYNELKEDFTQMVYHPRFFKFSTDVSVLNKFFFDNVVYTREYDAFLELMDEYYIKVDVEKLKEDIERIEQENIEIKNEINRTNKMNRDILNSRSWRYTQPLRSIKNR